MSFIAPINLTFQTISDCANRKYALDDADSPRLLFSCWLRRSRCDGIFRRGRVGGESKSELLALDEVTSTTGGRVLLTHDSNQLHRAVRQINDELRTQYVLGYLPGKSIRDGKWHKIKVEMNATKPRKLRICAKKGYYSPVDRQQPTTVCKLPNSECAAVMQ